MENLSRSLPRKTYGANVSAGKTVYDDVFGGPPKFGVPTLSPRLEDYTEIFQGFHASRGSSIPVLDLPAVVNDDIFFDVRSSNFDYSEVFGGFDGLDFAVSYEDLFNQSNAGDDTSDEAWTPAQSESLSDESDPSACSGKDQILLNGDFHQSFERTKQINISYLKANQTCKEDMSKGMTQTTQLDGVPEYSFVVNEILPAQMIEDKKFHLQVTSDLKLDKDFGGGITEGKKIRKTLSQPLNSDFSTQAYENELDHSAWQHNKNESPRETFLAVSDISLKTQPSHLPPPSRPPPAFADKEGNSTRLKSKLKASKSYAFERMAGDNSPPYFDVEIDASSSAAASAAAMKDAVEKAQAKLRSAKELKERKKEGQQAGTKLHLENDIKYNAEKMSETFDIFNSVKDERVEGKYERDDNDMKIYAGEPRKKVKNTTQVVSGSIDEQEHIHVGNSELSDHGMDHMSSRGSHKSEGTIVWREAPQFYEVAENKQVIDGNTSVQHLKLHDYGQNEKGVMEAYEPKAKATRMDSEWEENVYQFEVPKGACQWVENKGRRIANKGSHRQEGHQEKANAAQKVCELKGFEKKTRVNPQNVQTEEIVNRYDKCQEVEILIDDLLKENEVEFEEILKGDKEKVEYEKSIKEAHDRKESGMKPKETFESEECERELKEDAEPVGDEKILKEIPKQYEVQNQESVACDIDENENKQERPFERVENENNREEAYQSEMGEKMLKEVFEPENSGDRLNMDLKKQENKKEKKGSCEVKQDEERLIETLVLGRNKGHSEETLDRLNNDFEREEKEKRLKEALQQKERKKKLQEANESGENEKKKDLAFKEESTEDRSKVVSEKEDCKNRNKDDPYCNGFRGQKSSHEQVEREGNDRKLNLNEVINASIQGQKSDGACKLNELETPRPTRGAGDHGKNHGKMDGTQKVSLSEENERSRKEPNNCKRELEATEGENELFEERFNSCGIDQNDLQHEKINVRTEAAKESLHLHERVTKSDGDSIGIEGIYNEECKGASDTHNTHILIHKQGEVRKSGKGLQFDLEGSKSHCRSSEVIREWVEHGRKMGNVLPSVFDNNRNTQNTGQKFTSQGLERKEKSFNEKLTIRERDREERLKRERELENEHLRKIEEEREREREREKDRMAVDTATLEGCERAAVERATAEVRQRALAEARERLEKASAEARERLTTSMEARLRAERAAVERATAEARERAFEKAMAEKASFEVRERVERSPPDNFSASFMNGGLRHSSSSSDLQDLKNQSLGSSRGLQYSYSSIQVGLEGESPQRCKARLERYQRTAERAAKALAEKNMRDLLAHREQAERSRLAETLDADVKRWSRGKEGNLRALLSTLQYILGPDSGWQPIPLTEVITAVAVKKAYRKATLCVHPDKLQQRGASIQQKYICEKVFDLLKEAWNKFNSEER